jgi:hypothetical protein
MDDENSMVWNWHYSISGEPLSEEEREEQALGNSPASVDQTTFRSFANMTNNWRIDREAQRTKSFTGISGINTQDRAVQESMGPIVDRSREFLGPADMAIVTARRMLLASIRTVQDGGAPLGTGNSYYTVRAMQDLIPNGVDWREPLLPLMYPADTP